MTLSIQRTGISTKTITLCVPRIAAGCADRGTVRRVFTGLGLGDVDSINIRHCANATPENDFCTVRVRRTNVRGEHERARTIIDRLHSGRSVSVVMGRGIPWWWKIYLSR